MANKQRIMCIAPGRAAPGMVLAKPVHDREGAILLTAETVLDPAVLERLIRRGVEAVSVRVPDHRVTQALHESLGQPLLGTTLILPGSHEALNDPQLIREHFQKTLQAVIDAGACPMQPTTVIDLVSGTPLIVREGRGELARLGLSSA